MDNKGKGSIIFYCEHLDALEKLTNEQLGRLVRCLFKYVLGTLEESDVKNDIYIPFMFLKTQINIDKAKYEKRVEKAKKAIAARWEKHRKNTPSIHNVNVNGNVNVNDNVNDNEKATTTAAKASVDAFYFADGEVPSAPVVVAAVKDNFWKKDMTDQEIETFVAWFNYYMRDSRIPCVRRITEKRKFLIRAIWDEHNLDDLKKAFFNASQSSFLNGKTPNRFLATFEWIMQEKNFIRILEGNFNA